MYMYCHFEYICSVKQVHLHVFMKINIGRDIKNNNVFLWESLFDQS